jgi:hypothetical protein
MCKEGYEMIGGTRSRTMLLVMLAMLLVVVLVIDWSLAVTGVTAAVIGGVFRVVLQVVGP